MHFPNFERKLRTIDGHTSLKTADTSVLTQTAAEALSGGIGVVAVRQRLKTCVAPVIYIETFQPETFRRTPVSRALMARRCARGDMARRSLTRWCFRWAFACGFSVLAVVRLFRGCRF